MLHEGCVTGLLGYFICGTVDSCNEAWRMESAAMDYSVVDNFWVIAQLRSL